MSLRAIKKRSLGRLQLLSWLNSFLESDYAKIDHLGDGVAYMQILDAVFPKKVPLHKLNFDAQSEDERLSNLRILERSFEHVGLKKDIQAKRLAKCIAEHLTKHAS